MEIRPIPVVLHHLALEGLAEPLARFKEIDLVITHNDRQVISALEHGAPILVTYAWDDRFLSSTLRWVQSCGAGFEKFPLADLDARGVVLTTASGAAHVGVAEGAFGLVLALMRGIAAGVRDAGSRTWAEHPYPELAGSTVGIVGLGTIGEAFARRAAGWDVRLIGYKQHPSEYNGVVERVLGPGQLIDVCRESDVLVVTMPGSTETHHLIGRAELEALGHGFLVNVGRGSVVDEAALIEALATGQLRGAGLDVFETEPLPPDSRLWELSNVIITPHNLGNTTHLETRLMEIVSENLATYLGSGQNWRNRVVGGRRFDKWPAESVAMKTGRF